MIPVRRLNHAVLYVRDLDRACAFYRDLFGFEEVARERSVMAFLKAGGSANHHDLGLMAVGPQAPSPPRGSVGLYHLARPASDRSCSSDRTSIIPTSCPGGNRSPTWW